jgi:hypothetical protein
MGSGVDLSMKYAPDAVVKEIHIQGIWQPNLLRPLRRQVVLKEPLRQIGGVPRGRAILLEHIVALRIRGREPGYPVLVH